MEIKNTFVFLRRENFVFGECLEVIFTAMFMTNPSVTKNNYLVKIKLSVE